MQERLYPTMNCFGCGQASIGGLHLKSYVTPGGVIATFTPLPVHNNGTDFVNGGILATILDCHTGAVIFANAYERGVIDAAGAASFSFLTSGIDVRFLRPTPLGPPLEVWGEMDSISDTEMIARAEVRYEGKVRVTARAMWKRFTPRPSPK